MKSGLKIGNQAEVEITVDDGMLAAFPDEPVHELYSTASLVGHMEWAARKALRPYLDSDEEGMGIHVEVSHLLPTTEGMKVTVRATVTEVRESRVVCDVEAFSSMGRIARGSVKQAIVDQSWLKKKMNEISLIDKIKLDAREAGSRQTR